MEINIFQLWSMALTFLSMAHPVGGKLPESVEKLYKKIFEENNAKLRPLRNQTQVLILDIFFHITALVDVSEVEQKVEFNAWVNLSWIDEIRVWNSTEFDDMRMFFPEPGDTWTPRLLVSNSIEKTDVFEDDPTYHFIKSDGSTFFYPSGVFRVSCNMKMSYFPFDTQSCHVRVLTKYLASFVQFRVSGKVDKDSATSGFQDHGEWSLSGVNQYVEEQAFEGETYSVFFMTFHLTRKPTFVVLVVVLPVILLSMISLLVFLLPAESGEKVSFGITVLLSLSVFTSFVSDLLPRNSQSLPILVIYLFGLMVMSGISVVTTILTLASSTDDIYGTINGGNNNGRNHHTAHNNNNNNEMTMDNSEEIANVMRLLRGTGTRTGVHGFDDCSGSDKGNFRRTSQTNYRSGSNKVNRCNHAGGNRSPSPVGSVGTSHIINQWSNSDQTAYLQNGFSPGMFDTHASTGNGLTQGASNLDTYHHGNAGNARGRRSSILGFGSVFDRRDSSRNSRDSHRRAAGLEGQRGCGSTFLNRISRGDKILFCSFMLVWLVLTAGFMLFSTLK